MPPCLDVYALSPLRDRETIESFVARYVSVVDPLLDAEVLVLPLDASDDLPVDEWDVIPVVSVDGIVDLGLSSPRRVFTVHLRAASPRCGAILCFACNDEVTFGVSVDDPLDSDEAMATATSVLHELCEDTAASCGWVIWERQPSSHPHRDRPWDAHGVRATYVRVDS